MHNNTVEWRVRDIPSLVMIGALRLISFLPYRAQIFVGSILGWLLLLIAKRWKETARKNIHAVFQTWTPHQRNNLLRENFRSLGVALIESAISWWTPDSKLHELYEINGLEHVQQALHNGNGVILLSAHFTTLEIGGRLLSLSQPIDAMFRKQNNAVFNHFMVEGRERFIDNLIPKNDIRNMLRNLKKNHVVWYAMDQHYRGKNSTFVDFFGIPASTNTATPRLAQASGAILLPFHARRRADNSGYTLIIGSPLKNIPSDDPVTDTQEIMKYFENEITKAPEQYLWIHRRFKTQPNSSVPFYSHRQS